MYNKLIWGFLSDDAFILVNKKIARMVGIHAAILLSDLISKHKYFCQKKGESYWFFNSRDNIEKDTCLSGHQQRHAQKILVVNKLLVIKRKGTTCRNYYLINYRKLHRLLISSSEGIEQLDIQKEEDKRSKRCTTINKNKNNTINKTLQDKPARSEKEKKAFKRVWELFEEHSGKPIPKYEGSLQSKSIWEMIDKAKESDADWAEYLGRVINAFFDIIKNKPKGLECVYNQQVKPHILNGVKIWMRVVNKLPDNTPVRTELTAHEEYRIRNGFV